MSELETQMEECGVCHALHPMADLVCFDDTLVCPECMEDTTTPARSQSSRPPSSSST